MGGFLTVLVYVVCIIAVVTRLRKKKLNDGKPMAADKPIAVNMPTTVNKPAVSAKPVSNYKNYKRHTSAGVNAHMAREKANVRDWEDRRGDWLARQMADEKAAQRRMSEMFQLKLEHKYNCDAEMLKQFHESHCDADGVDNAGA